MVDKVVTRPGITLRPGARVALAFFSIAVRDEVVVSLLENLKVFDKK